MKYFFFGTTTQLFIIVTANLFILLIFVLSYIIQMIINAWLISFSLLMIVFILYIDIAFFTRKITISKEGVSFSSLTQKYKLSWEEIKYVELTMVSYPRTTKEYLVFSTRYVISSELMKSTGSNEFIKMENKSERVLRVVRRYWKESIIGIDHLDE